ncbi:MAG: hypothetical protein WCP34_09730, partial [Pseudomonadota bacterium]
VGNRQTSGSREGVDFQKKGMTTCGMGLGDDESRKQDYFDNWGNRFLRTKIRGAITGSLPSSPPHCF